jgi:hypothetical protein
VHSLGQKRNFIHTSNPRPRRDTPLQSSPRQEQAIWLALNRIRSPAKQVRGSRVERWQHVMKEVVFLLPPHLFSLRKLVQRTRAFCDL